MLWKNYLVERLEEALASVLGSLNVFTDGSKVGEEAVPVLVLDVLDEGAGGESDTKDGRQTFLLVVAQLAVDESEDVGLGDDLAVILGLQDQILGFGDDGDDLGDVLGLDRFDELVDD